VQTQIIKNTSSGHAFVEKPRRVHFLLAHLVVPGFDTSATSNNKQYSPIIRNNYWLDHSLWQKRNNILGTQVETVKTLYFIHVNNDIRQSKGQPHEGQGHRQTGQDTRHAFGITAWFSKINKHYRVWIQYNNMLITYATRSYHLTPPLCHHWHWLAPPLCKETPPQQTFIIQQWQLCIHYSI